MTCSVSPMADKGEGVWELVGGGGERGLGVDWTFLGHHQGGSTYLQASPIMYRGLSASRRPLTRVRLDILTGNAWDSEIYAIDRPRWQRLGVKGWRARGVPRTTHRASSGKL